jgi:ABC-type multidrug transport system fused ATPase/permease subunit
VLLLSLFSALIDLFVLMLIQPAIQFLTFKEPPLDDTFVVVFQTVFQSESIDNLRGSFWLFFVCVFLASSLTKLLLVVFLNQCSYKLVADLNKLIIEDYLKFPIAQRDTQERTGELIAALSAKTLQISTCGVLPAINLFTACSQILFIVFGLYSLYSNIVILSLCALIILVGFLYTAVASQLEAISVDISTGQNKSIILAQEIVGGIRDLQIFQLVKYTVDIFYLNEQKLRTALSMVQIVVGALRPLIECLVAIAFLAGYLIYSDSFSSVADDVNLIPVLGVLGFAAQRMLPGMQVIFGSITAIKGNWKSIDDVLRLLETTQSIQRNRSIDFRFQRKISLVDVGFSYQGRRSSVVSNVNIEIPKGRVVAIVGPSGSGKSSIADLISGFLLPSSGRVLIDNTVLDEDALSVWQQKIAYISQKPFIFDSTLGENVAPGLHRSLIDIKKVQSILDQVGLTTLVNSSSEGIWANVGESGRFLSGGQIQRLALARSLYFDREVLILDEGMNALDINTRAKIRQIVYSKKKITLIVISHDIDDLPNCDLIYKVENGTVACIKN